MNRIRLQVKSIRWLIVLIAILLSLSQFTHAQQEENSLYRSYENNPTIASSDTARIHKLIRQGNNYLTTNLDSAAITLQKAKSLSIATRYSKGLANSLISLSYYYSEKGDYPQAINTLWEALPYAQRSALQDKGKTMIQWYTCMAKMYVFGVEHDSAIIYLRKAEKVAMQLKDTLLLFRTNFNIGTLWLNNQRYDNAIHYLKKAELLTRNNDKEKLCLIYNNLCNVYNNINDRPNFYLYASKALKISVEERLPAQQKLALMHLGYYFLKSAKLDSAELYFKQAVTIPSVDMQWQAYPYWGISKVYYERKQLDIAKQYAMEALKIQPKEKLPATIVTANLYIYLSQLYFDLGDYKTAFSYQAEYSGLSDSLNKTERNKALDKLEMKSRIAEKDKEIFQKELLLSREQGKLKNRNIWIAAISLCVISIAILFLSFYRNSRRKLYILRQEEEINNLKAMMNGEEKERNRIARELHDGIGGLLSAAAINLNTLSDEHTSLETDPVYQKTSMLIDAIGNEVRKTAHNLMPDVLLRHNLPEAVRLFCSYVQKGKNLDIKILANGSFDNMRQDFLLSVYRIIQELVQNIIKHAQAGNAFIQLHTDETMMSITVEDDGMGYNIQAPGNGMGLQNIQTRVKTMNGNMNIESTPDNGTSVYIEFDIKTYTA